MTVCAVLVNNFVNLSALFRLGSVLSIVDHPKGSENDVKIDETGTVELNGNGHAIHSVGVSRSALVGLCPQSRYGHDVNVEWSNSEKICLTGYEML